MRLPEAKALRLAPKARVPWLALALCAATLAAWSPGTAQAATAANTLVVNASVNLRPVTHVASGALYGLSANCSPAAGSADPLPSRCFGSMGRVSDSARQSPAARHEP